jgi:uncharacterized protein YyaL (SSP411 family)
MREMQSPEGGYYSSLDADSEHEEGKFYIWSREEAVAVLDEEEYAVAGAVYGLDKSANFEGRHWHLHIAQPPDRLAERLGLAGDVVQHILERARDKLFVARVQRVRPGRDEKILTSWNALMIHGMLHAGRVLGRAEWIDSARRALDFLRAHLWRAGRLLATFKDGRAHLNAYLDDHAFLLAALLESMQADFRRGDLDFAVALADLLLTQFEDQDHGGFFFTSHDHEQLILRPKPGFDNATPSGNAVAALTLQRLGHLLGDPRYLTAAERTLWLFYPQLARHPSGFATLCMALAEHDEPPPVTILRGDATALSPWQEALAQRYAPAGLVLGLDSAEPSLPPALDKPVRPGVNAWLCRGVNCLAPIGELDALLREHVPKAGERL